MLIPNSSFYPFDIKYCIAVPTQIIADTNIILDLGICV